MTVDGHGALANRLGELLGSRNSVAAVAVINPDGTSVASRGTAVESDFEIGSISKGFTGLLYADALARGEITPQSTLGDFLPLGDAAAARVSLDSLSTHSSGLPRLPEKSLTFRRALDIWRHGSNPYGETLDELMAQAKVTTPGKSRSRYSNFGFELLGHAVARAAGLTYTDLLRLRITDPLALEHTYAPATPEELRPEAVIGTSRHGRPQQAWTGEALAPAGGIRSTIGDMARFTEALLGDSAPGIAALEPRNSFGVGGKIGAAWLTVSVKHQETTWHNGGTGGFRSWMGLNRSAGTGVVILSATAASVDRQGFRLLTDPSARSALT